MSKMVITQRATTEDLQQTNLHPLLARIYSARGVTGVEQLEYILEKLLSFNDLMGIDKAVARLVTALEQQEKIMIVGDFDADGATSTTLVVSALRMMGAGQVAFIVPNRFEYGYGLSPEIVVEAAKQKPHLIITVDNGISSVEGVAKANELGIDVVVTDHHLAPQVLPDAVAIVNPNQQGDNFASKNIAGVGVIFYVMLALRSQLRELGWFAARKLAQPNMGSLLDLVALGTVADVVVLDQNNRILVRQGIERMRAGRVRPGIKALLEIGGRKLSKLKSTDLGFVVGPRLNAAGRLDDMSIGIQCLLAEDEVEAQRIARELDDLNKERRQIEDQMKQEAMAALGSIKLSGAVPCGICLYDEGWHQGVVGILASRIKDRFHRPVIAFAKVSDDEIKGSARSVTGVHIRDVLDSVATKHPGMILKFGGHAMAAGLSVVAARFDDFCQAFDEQIRAVISEDELRGKIMTDGVLDVDDFSLQVADLLIQAGPWGQGFPEPVFEGEFELIQQRLLKERHLKLVLAYGGGAKMLDAIAFNVDTKIWPNYECNKIRVVFKLDINEWQGRRNVQLLVDHLQPID